MSRTQRTVRTRSSRKIDRKKVAELAQQGLGVTDIAAHQGVHHSTISRYLSRLSLEGKVIKQFSESRGDALALVHAKALDVQDILLDAIQSEICDERLFKALSPHQKVGYLNAAAMVGGVSYDKYRLEVGKSTSNVSVLSKIIDETHDAMRKPQGSQPKGQQTTKDQPQEEPAHEAHKAI